MLYGFSCGMASASTRRSRLAKAVGIRKWKISQRKQHRCIVIPNFPFYSTTPTNSGSARPQNWLFSSIKWHLYKKKHVQPGLGCCCLKMQWIITHRNDHLSTYSKTLFLKWIMPVKEYYEDEDENMNKMANFSFGWYSHNASFLLDTY